MSASELRPPDKSTGIQKVVKVAGLTVGTRAWMFWMTVLVISLVGDHASAWDIDSMFANGHITHPQDLAMMLSSVMVVVSMMSKRK